MNLSFASLFGPMDSSNCDYFLIISIVGALALLMSIVYAIVKYDKNSNFLIVILSVCQPFILYFQNRLLYNMCVSKIN